MGAECHVCGHDMYDRCGWCELTARARDAEAAHFQMVRKAGELRDQRDHWIRLFNRLQGAITHHRQADRFADDNDDALWAATDRIMRDAALGLPNASGKKLANDPNQGDAA